MAAEHPTGRGHASLPHTADVRIAAWGPDAPACYEEAVAAFTGTFAEVDADRRGAALAFEVGPGSPSDLLALLLEQVVFEVEVRGVVARSARVERCGDGRLTGTFSVVPVEAVDAVGPLPKGVSHEDLAFAPGPDGWRCTATVDV